MKNIIENILNLILAISFVGLVGFIFTDVWIEDPWRDKAVNTCSILVIASLLIYWMVFYKEE